MNDPLVHAGRGALWAVGLASVILSFGYGSHGPLKLPFIWIAVALIAGPAAYLLAVPLAWILDRGPGSKRMLVGLVLGLPLGVLLAALAVMADLGEARLPFDALRPLLPAGIAGGAGLGFGTALKDDAS